MTIELTRRGNVVYEGITVFLTVETIRNTKDVSIVMARRAIRL